MQSFADETLAPAAPLPPAVFTSSVTRQSICPAGHSNCNISAQLNSYFVSAAQRYNLEPALLAAIQQNEAPINNPSIVGPAPSEGDMNDRAIGLMQIRQSIARKLGIDPTSPEQSIFAAARLLSESLKRSNGNLARAVTEYHGGTNPANWGPKTENYVAKVFQHLHVQSGRFILSFDDKYMQKVAVIGTYVADQLFGETNPVGQKMKINGQIFKVVGVLAEKDGGEKSSGDDTVIIPYTVAQRLAKSARITSYLIGASSAEDVNMATANLKTYLTNIFTSDSRGYRVTSQEQMLSTLSDVTGSMSYRVVT